MAVIGCGGMGGGNPGVAASERAVALVDVNDKIMANAFKNHKNLPTGVRTYYDYRKMYDECQKDIDVVLIATPDHHHAPAAMRAIKAGKAVFVQKPMAHDVAECYALMKAAKEKNVPTQMGNQGHYGETIRLVCEYIWAGAIGKVTEAHAIFGRNFGGHGNRPPSKPVPQGLHWDEWIGPARFREYHEGLHPFSWRLAGVRHGHHRRHGLPQPGRALLGPPRGRCQALHHRVPLAEAGQRRDVPHRQRRPLDRARPRRNAGRSRSTPTTTTGSSRRS